MARSRKNKEVETKEIIPTVDVGAEVVEQALVDNPELSEEFIEDALKATQEIEEGLSSMYQKAYHVEGVSKSEFVKEYLDIADDVTVSHPLTDMVKEVNGDSSIALRSPTVGDASSIQQSLDKFEEDCTLSIAEKSLESLQEKYGDIESLAEALQEGSPSGDTEVSDLGENVSESVTEPSEAIVENNKQTLINGQGNPVPTTQITLRHVNMEKMVADILQVAYIGGDLDPTFYPRLNAVPYLCKVLLPTDMVEIFENKTQLAEYHEDGEVVLVKAFDVINLVKQLIEVGKKGYVLTPKKAVLTRGKFLASVTGRVPIKPSINFNVDVRTLAKYTREELTSFDLATLKGLGERYGVNHRGKVPLIAMILKAQQE